MLSEPAQVVVTPAGHSALAVQPAAVHHRDFPKVRSEGQPPGDAAARRADRPARTPDGAPGAWLRVRPQQAVGNVSAFARRVPA
jgi:hypothetical protein